jgi:putative two-component system response regulator
MNKISNCTVLVVDDTEANIDILVETLGSEYEVSVAIDGEGALQIINTNLPDLILLDIMMPGIDGYEVCRRLKSEPETSEIPIVFITSMSEIQNKTKGFELGAVDYITRPFEVMEVKARVKTHLSLMLARKELANQNIILEEKVKERTKELVKTQDVIIFSMALMAEFRDSITGGHIKRTQNYVKVLAEHLKHHDKFRSFLDNNTIDILYKSAPLHDIGKVAVRDEVLLNPGKLTDDAFEQMKKHTIYGRDTILAAQKKLGNTSFLRIAREIAYTHHEKWDGTGYPQGIKGNEIPISGRLMAVADVYDAFISKRSYKPAFSHEKALKMILENKGKHFDPDVVDAFTELGNTFRKIALKYKDFGEE